MLGAIVRDSVLAEPKITLRPVFKQNPLNQYQNFRFSRFCLDGEAQLRVREHQGVLKRVYRQP